jgi:hypothetical protein
MHFPWFLGHYKLNHIFSCDALEAKASRALQLLKLGKAHSIPDKMSAAVTKAVFHLKPWEMQQLKQGILKVEVSLYCWPPV